MSASSVARSSFPRRGRPPTAGLHESILAAAEKIFAHGDYHEVLVDDVAQACGIGKGTIYRYFPSKRELYVAVMFEGVERLRAELEAAVDRAGPPILKLERAVHCVLAHFWDRRFFFTLIHRNEHLPDHPDTRDWLRRRAELGRIFQHLIADATAAGQIQRIDPRIATELLFGMLRGANRYRGSHDTLDDMV